MVAILKMGRKIYYDILTGQRIVEIGERDMYAVETTVEQDMATFTELSERNRDSFDFIQLDHGQYYSDFIECHDYRVNPSTKKLEFSYPGPNDSEAQPIYQKPLSEKVAELEMAQESTNTTLLELMEMVLLS